MPVGFKVKRAVQLLFHQKVILQLGFTCESHNYGHWSLDIISNSRECQSQHFFVFTPCSTRAQNSKSVHFYSLRTSNCDLKCHSGNKSDQYFLIHYTSSFTFRQKLNFNRCQRSFRSVVKLQHSHFL